jgi:uncharacterized radical SAM superfamily Fe-S cluster-containing enzyme
MALQIPAASQTHKKDVDYVFHELTRSICPVCRRVIDAQVLLREDKVYMRKRCPEHGEFESLVYGDAQAYTSNNKFNKPGTIPLQYSTEVVAGCPMIAVSVPTTSSTPVSASSKSTLPAIWIARCVSPTRGMDTT